jgi:hypothetical protein
MTWNRALAWQVFHLLSRTAAAIGCFYLVLDDLAHAILVVLGIFCLAYAVSTPRPHEGTEHERQGHD